MSSGLYSGSSGLNLGTSLYKAISGLWSGATGFVTGSGVPPTAIADRAGAYILDRAGAYILTRT